MPSKLNKRKNNKSSFNLLELLKKIAFVLLIVFFASFIYSLFSPEDANFSFQEEIAYLKLQGVLHMQHDTAEGTNALDFVKLLEKAEKDPSIKAIIIEVNSTGGSAVAANQIYQKIKDINKPVVVWLSDVAASAAYYAVSSADYIVADKHSIVGSIGAIFMVANFYELLEKLGVRFYIIKAGKLKDFASPFKKELTDEEVAIIQQILEEIHEQFKKDVLSARSGKINEAKFKKIADGRIMLSNEAKNIGLVDSIGTFNDAIEKAKELANIEGETKLREFKIDRFDLLSLFSGLYLSNILDYFFYKAQTIKVTA